MTYSYLVTTQKPTAVQHAVVCNFTSATERNLILVKSNRIEIHTLMPEGLMPILDTPLNGRIVSIDYYRPTISSQDVLFLLLESKQFCILGFDPSTKTIINRARGNVRDKAGRDIETGPRGFVDPDGRVIGMHLYEGLLKVVPIESSSLREAYNVRLEELRLLDIVFLHGCAKPTLCVLFEDARRGRHLKTYTLDSREKELLEGPLHQNNIEQGAHMLIPIPGPANGVIIVGQCSISYVGDGGYCTSVGIQRKQLISFGAIDSDGSRYLLSDTNGMMYVLILQREGQHVAGLVVEQLGITSIPQCLCYLDNGVVFVGSCYGDSQLVKLLSTPDSNGEHVEVLERYVNIGPVLDMCVVQSERQGQSQLVTCSGAYKDGSIRVIRSGIGIQEQASLDVPGIKSVWSLYGASDRGFDKYLVQSFAWDTRVLALENDELGEVMIPGLSNTHSLYCGNMCGDMMLQITATSARLIDLVSLHLLSEFTAPSKILVASANRTQVVLALSGGDVLYLEADANTKSLLHTATTKLDQDVACLSLRPVFFDNNEEASSAPMESEPMEVTSSTQPEINIHDTLLPEASAFILAVGLWTENSVRLFALPSLLEITRVSLGVDTQVRDVMLVSFANRGQCVVSVEEDISSDVQDVRFSHCHLLVGLGDGMLLTYVLDLSEQTLPKLQDRREIIIGSRPISFSCFVNEGSLCVFAACDRPTVIYTRTSSSRSSVEKLLFSVANTSEVTNMAPFHTPLFPSCLALSSDSGLCIGTVDAIQKIHIQSFPLDESPRRLCHHLSSASIAVCSERTVRSPSGEYTNERVLLLDDATITPKDVYEMEAMEQTLSCASMYLAGLDTEVLVIGTALVLPEEHQPSKGRILVFEVTHENKLRLLCEKNVAGAVYAVASVNGRLAVACDSSVDVFRWQLQEGSTVADLTLECSHHGNILALLLKAQDDVLLVGDVFRSVSVLKHSTESREMQELCRDFNSHYMRAIEIWRDGFYVCSEDKGNIFIGRRNTTAESEEERGKLEIVSGYHTGEYLNAMRPGSLSNQLGDHNTLKTKNDASATPQSILMGGVSGALMTLMTLTEEEYKFFAALEKSILHVVKGAGGLPHDEWRTFASERRQTFTRRTIDGDLIELFLELSNRGMQQAVSHLNGELNVKPSTLESRRGQARTESKPEDQLANYSVEDVVLRVDEMARRHQ